MKTDSEKCVKEWFNSEDDLDSSLDDDDFREESKCMIWTDGQSMGMKKLDLFLVESTWQPLSFKDFINGLNH